MNRSSAVRPETCSPAGGGVTSDRWAERWIEEVLEQSSTQVAQYRAGKAQVMGFLVGQARSMVDLSWRS